MILLQTSIVLAFDFWLLYSWIRPWIRPLWMSWVSPLPMFWREGWACRPPLARVRVLLRLSHLSHLSRLSRISRRSCCPACPWGTESRDRGTVGTGFKKTQKTAKNPVPNLSHGLGQQWATWDGAWDSEW